MQSNNNITALRDELFATIRALRDEEKPMDIARAKAVSEVAQTIINSAKVEVEMIEALGLDESTGFLDSAPKAVISGMRVQAGNDAPVATKQLETLPRSPISSIR